MYKILTLCIMNISELPTNSLSTNKLATNNVSCLVGSVTFFAYVPSGLNTTSIPGFLVCNGSFVSKTTYANLYNFLNSNNTNYPQNSTEFQLPDLRGVFIRNTPFGGDKDPDGSSSRVSNTFQAYAIKRLSGRMGVYQNDYDRVDRANGVFTRDRSTGDTDSSRGGDNCGQAGFDNAREVATSNNESRPNNIAFLACIKY